MIEATPLKPKNNFKILLIIVGAIILFIIGLYLFANYPALYLQFTSARSSNDLRVTENTLPNGDKIDLMLGKNQNLLFLSNAFYYPAPPKEIASPSPTASDVADERSIPAQDNYSVNTAITSSILNNQLVIPRTGVRVPIVWDSSVDESTMLANLRNGVVHYAGTAKPDDSIKNNSGNVFISGHSSYYNWDDGNYKTVFATLDNLNIGDQFAIGYNDKVYVYKIFEKVVVNPGDVSVVVQDTSKPIASLMTCVPVGTNLQRLVVKGNFEGYAQ